jgi:hypothetical protein
MADWISKPVSALNDQELALWRAMRLPALPLSQEISWGRAALAIGRDARVVFSPQRRVSALFLISGDQAECVNGPVLDWPRIGNSRELNEQLGMVVYALHRAVPGLRSILLRPRLSGSEYEFLRNHSAFPVDRIDRASTVVIPVGSSCEWQWQALPGRIRHEVSRAHRAGARARVRDAKEGFAGFWDSLLAFYQKRSLFAPELRFMEALLGQEGVRAWIVTSRHLSSASEAGVLVVNTQETAFYLYAYEERTEECPNISLNALAQWDALRLMIDAGIQNYDLNGILNPLERSDVAHEGGAGGFRGVDAYKRKFKGVQVDYIIPSIVFA